MKCADCRKWLTRRVTRYGDGSEIEHHKSAEGKGQCQELGIETPDSFGCNAFQEGACVDVSFKDGAPWRHFAMIPCPDCGGLGDGSRGHRCAGTGLVRLYDDGYVGDEQTRMHPKEKELAAPPKCLKCSAEVSIDWVACPRCGNRLMAVASPEVIDDPFGNGGGSF